MVANFREEKNYSAQHGTDGNFYSFRLFRETGNTRNSVPSHSAEDKNAWNSVPNYFLKRKTL